MKWCYSCKYTFIFELIGAVLLAIRFIPLISMQAERIIKEFNGISLGNKNSNRIYLTFDCGYEAGYTESILNILKEKLKHPNFGCFLLTLYIYYVIL